MLSQANRGASMPALALLAVMLACGTTADAQSIRWTLASPAGAVKPSPRSGHAMVYDSARGVTVLFGGAVTGGLSGETWEWNGTAWTLRSPSGPAPSARSGHAMAFDSNRAVTVLFGGRDAAGIQGDTWEWDGTTWTIQPAGLAGPAGRTDHAMTFAPGGGGVVIFGGSDGTTVLGDLWTSDGSGWNQQSLAASAPGPRMGHAMCWDRQRSRLTIFGGNLPGGGNETWAYDGITWFRALTEVPAARQQPAMSFDTLRQVSVMFGAVPAGAADTREWDGSNWTLRRTAPGATAPAPRFAHAMVYDAARDVTVLFGGRLTGGTSSNETWQLAAHVPATTDLGVIGVGRISRTLPQAAGVTSWLRLELGWPVDGSSGGFLDIDTEGTVLNNHNDTCIGLYDAAGRLVAWDDNSGSLLLSALSFGTDSPVRPGSGDGLDFDGRDGLDLPAGTYFLGVTGFFSLFNPTSWDVINTSNASGTLVVNIWRAGAADCLADVVRDGTVDGGDFIAFINSFALGDATIDPTADVIADGTIEGNDFIAFINAFAAGC